MSEHDRLLSKLVDGSLSPDEEATLLESAADDPRLLADYLDLIEMHAVLGYESRTTNAHRPERPASAGRSNPRSIAPATWAISIAAAIVLSTAALAIYLLVATLSAPDPIDGPDGPPIATLIEATGDAAVVFDDNLAYEGQEYAPGAVSIESGSAQFQLTSGATVTMRGRTEMVMHSSRHATLYVGAAEFHCPARAVGYTVSLPGGARVVDLGTAFDIGVDEAGNATIRVTEGSVRVEPAGETPSFVLTANMSVALADRNSTVDKFMQRIVPVSYAYIGDLKPGPAADAPQTDDRRDTDNAELTDGVIGTGSFVDRAWVGVVNTTGDPNRPSPSILFDLGESHTISAVRITYLVDHDGGVSAPTRATVAVGDEPDSLEPVANDTAFDNSPDPKGNGLGDARSHTIELAPRTARFVRIDLFNSQQWTFIGEVEFIGAADRSQSQPSSPRGARARPERSGTEETLLQGDSQ